MPRRNRPRAGDDDPAPPRLREGLHVETRRGRAWNVQPLDAAQAAKEYRCPGCGLVIEPGVAHLVVWRADGVLGETADLEARRHWHRHCWRVS